MNITDIKSKMMKLWKDTFHDSDAYITLIFEEYFNPKYIEYHEENGQIISGLIGIPYFFGNKNNKIKGLYLCGLATKEEYRHKGIMNNLMNKINDKAKNEGFALSFLIPSSDILRIYYQDKGYVNAMYRVEERYTDIHNFHNDCVQNINREEDRLRNIKLKYFDNLITDVLERFDDDYVIKISQYIQKKEQENQLFNSLLHSSKDTIIIIKENFISGGEIIFAKNENGDIKGIAFITFDGRKRITIPKIYYDDQCVFFKLLDKAKKMHPESSMSVLRYPEETNRHALWAKIYGPSNPEGGMLGGAYGVTERVYDVSLHSQPYGMAKILNIDEILIFLAKYRNDVKFSIIIKQDNPEDKTVLYKIETGKVLTSIIEGNQIKELKQSFPTITMLSHRNLSEILFRKKDGNNLIMEAFGIPRLAMNMALLLD